MRTIYCDLDGVLCDFNSRFERMFKKAPSQVARDKKEGEFSTYWNTFVESLQFATLDKMPDADELINFLKSIATKKNYRVAILTSTGGFDRHNNVMIQKRIWVENQATNWPIVFVPGRRFKAGYADKYSLLIDDTYDVIESFEKGGGTAIWHKDAATTIERVRQWMS